MSHLVRKISYSIHSKPIRLPFDKHIDNGFFVSPVAPVSVTYRFSKPRSKILNSTVLDSVGRHVFRIQSDNSTTRIYDKCNKGVASVEWKKTPILKYRSQEVEARQWLPLNHRKCNRHLRHHDMDYEWVTHGGCRYLQTAPGRYVAVWRQQGDSTEVEVLPPGLHSGISEAVIISVVILQSGKSLGDDDENITSKVRTFCGRLKSNTPAYTDSCCSPLGKFNYVPTRVDLLE